MFQHLFQQYEAEKGMYELDREMCDFLYLFIVFWQISKTMGFMHHPLVTTAPPPFLRGRVGGYPG